jgi:hypothetical protein
MPRPPVSDTLRRGLGMVQAPYGITVGQASRLPDTSLHIIDKEGWPWCLGSRDYDERPTKGFVARRWPSFLFQSPGSSLEDVKQATICPVRKHGLGESTRTKPFWLGGLCAHGRWVHEKVRPDYSGPALHFGHHRKTDICQLFEPMST